MGGRDYRVTAAAYCVTHGLLGASQQSGNVIVIRRIFGQPDADLGGL